MLSYGKFKYSVNNPEKIHTIASDNFAKYCDIKKELSYLESNDAMLTNIEDMKNRLHNKLENGKIKKDDFTYKQLASTIEQAISIKMNNHRMSVDGICQFYEAYNNFNDMIGGR